MSHMQQGRRGLSELEQNSMLHRSPLQPAPQKRMSVAPAFAGRPSLAPSSYHQQQQQQQNQIYQQQHQYQQPAPPAGRRDTIKTAVGNSSSSSSAASNARRGTINPNARRQSQMGAPANQPHMVDPRPITDKAFLKKCAMNVHHFLQTHNFREITLDNIQHPSSRDFVDIVQFLCFQIDPYYTIHKIEEDFPALLQELKYPFRVGSKNSIKGVISPSAWNGLLAAIAWLVELLSYIEYANNFPVPIDLCGDLPADNEKSFFRYLSYQYAMYFTGQEVPMEMEADLENQFGLRRKRTMEEISTIEQQIVELEEQIQNIQRETELGRSQERILLDAESDLSKFHCVVAEWNQYNSNLREKISVSEQIFEERSNILNAVKEEHDRCTALLNAQSLSPESIAAIRQEMADFDRQLEVLAATRAQATQNLSETEQARDKKVQQVERLICTYSHHAISLELVQPSPSSSPNIEDNHTSTFTSTTSLLTSLLTNNLTISGAPRNTSSIVNFNAGDRPGKNANGVDFTLHLPSAEDLRRGSLASVSSLAPNETPFTSSSLVAVLRNIKTSNPRDVLGLDLKNQVRNEIVKLKKHFHSKYLNAEQEKLASRTDLEHLEVLLVNQRSEALTLQSQLDKVEKQKQQLRDSLTSENERNTSEAEALENKIEEQRRATNERLLKAQRQTDELNAKIVSLRKVHAEQLSQLIDRIHAQLSFLCDFKDHVSNNLQCLSGYYGNALTLVTNPPSDTSS